MKDIQINVAILMICAGLIGMWIHFLIAKRGKRISGNFFNYLLADNPQSTGITLFVYFGAIGGLFAIGAFDALRLDAAFEALKNGYLYAPLIQGLATSITTGYTCDSMLNKGATND